MGKIMIIIKRKRILSTGNLKDHLLEKERERIKQRIALLKEIEEALLRSRTLIEQM